MKDAEEECDRVYFQAKHAMKYLNKLIEENDDFKCNLAYSAEFPIKVGLMQVWLGRCFGMTYCPNAKGIAHETHERADVLQAKDINVFANAQRELQGFVWHTVELSSLEGTKSPMVFSSLPPLPVVFLARFLLLLLLLCYMLLTVAPLSPPPPPPSLPPLYLATVDRPLSPESQSRWTKKAIFLAKNVRTGLRASCFTTSMCVMTTATPWSSFTSTSFTSKIV